MYLLYIRICLPLQLVYSINEFGVNVFASDDEIWKVYTDGRLRPGLGLTGTTGKETRLHANGKDKETLPLMVVQEPNPAFNGPQL